MSAVTECLTSLANAIRAKIGITDKMRLEEMPLYIERIEGTVYSPDTQITDWGYFSYNNRHNDRVARLKKTDTISGKSFANMFKNSDKLTCIPDLNTGNGTNFSGMFYSNKALLKSPTIDTHSGIDFSYMYNCCESMTETPQISVYKGEYLQYMFWNCQVMADPLALQAAIPRNLEGLVRNSYLLPSLNLRAGFNDGALDSTVAMCHSCKALETVTGEFMTGKSGAAEMFCGCSKLHTIEGFRINVYIPDNAVNVWSQTFDWCYELTNLDISGENKWSGLNLKHSKKLSKESITKVVNTLSDNVAGKSITLSTEAVDNAFEDGGSAGYTFTMLCSSKPNWTIALM